jgi:hypothetical protein
MAVYISLFLALAIPSMQTSGLEKTIFLWDTGMHLEARINTSSHHGRICWARYLKNSGRLNNGTLEEKAFRVPCPEQMTPELISSLQRALKIRGYFSSAVTGHGDVATRMAVRAFQRDRGFDSPILTLDTVESLGLLPSPIRQ